MLSWKLIKRSALKIQFKGSPYFSDVAISSYPRRLRRELQSIIKAKGPLSVTEFMRLVNTHPQYGYYTYKDVFGHQGDFITAPEISQLFGEILAVFIMHSLAPLLQRHPKKRINFIELGPGRGTLLKDLLRVFMQFDGFRDRINGCILVERSTRLIDMQGKELRSLFPNITFHWENIIDAALHRTNDDDCLSVVYSNEFFDALPIHLFMRDRKEGWKDVMIDSLDAGDDVAFRFVTAPNPSPLADLLKLHHEGKFDEVSIDAKIVNDLISRHLLGNGGLYVCIDYGRVGQKSLNNFTLRAIKNHQILDNILEDVGECDLSTDVNFDAMRESFPAEHFGVVGPIEQGLFLRSFGIEQRLASLCRGKSPSQCSELKSGMHRLIDDIDMGKSYKVFSAITK